MKIKWINRFSREEGYVKYVDYKEKHFVNTWNYSEAKSFKDLATTIKAIDKLNDYGEGINNEFIPIE